MQPPQPDYCFLFIDMWFTCMQKAEWASWMQAVFSVAAIAAAIVIAFFQRADERRHSLLVQRASANVVADTVVLECGRAMGMLKGMRTRWYNEMEAASRLQQPQADLVSLRQLVMPTDEQLLHLAQIWPRQTRLLVLARSLRQSIIRALEQYIQDLAGGQGALTDLHELLADVDDAMENIDTASEGIRPGTGAGTNAMRA